MVYIYNGDVRELPGVADLGPLADCSVGQKHYAVVVRKEGSRVRCWGCNRDGKLGTGDLSERLFPEPTEPSLTDVLTVHCGMQCTMALDGSGRVATWGGSYYNRLGRRGDQSRPGILRELPPVARLVATRFVQLALTRNDEIWAWGIFGGEEPTRIATACGYRLRSVQLIRMDGFLGETSDGRLMTWSWHGIRDSKPKVMQTGNMEFPLRCLTGNDEAVATADASGAVWLLDPGAMTMHHAGFSGRAVHIVCTYARYCLVTTRVVVLTECGQLWETLDGVTGRNWRSISAAHPELPRGLIPFGGCYADKVMLAQDHCVGKHRLALFGRITARLGVPGDVVRAVLLPLTVHRVYIT
eukprot:TRINITY_DN15003_c0_g1_i1.p1 TRINITY_DN15003_c0_g1~~TRINITY_DN15003_c0_g1_i1.p1  ORF type:complete len:381 (+),score=64.60 TRINITY_DN15003_c0_g1_i1:79-1143(+)